MPNPPHELVAAAVRDLAAIRCSALPALAAENGRKIANPMAIAHAKHRVQSMLIAATERVTHAARLAEGERLAAELAAVVAEAVAAGAFAGYELLLQYVAAPVPAARAA